MEKELSYIHIYDRRDDFPQNIDTDFTYIALEEKLIRSTNGIEFKLADNDLLCSEAVQASDRLYRQALEKTSIRSDSILWWDILAPQIILYFLNKIIRLQNLLGQINTQFPGYKILHTSNPLIEAFGLDNSLFFNQVLSKYGLKDRLRRYTLQHIPCILQYFRCGKLLIDTAKATYTNPSLSNDCQALIWCENRVHEMTGFAVADILAENGRKAACIVSRDLKKANSLNILKFRDKQWLKSINKLVPDFIRTLHFMSEQIISELPFLSKSERYEHLKNLLFRELLHWYLPQAIDAFALSINILNRFKPEVVLIQDIADYRARIFAVQARERKIPVVLHQFGNIGRTSIEWKWDCADIYGVWGQWAKNIVVNQGVSENKVYIVGTPRISTKNINKSNTSNITLSKKKKVLFPLVPASSLTFGNGGALSVYECQEALRTLFRWVKNSNQDVELFIKPRPLGDDTWSIPLLKKAPNNVELLPLNMPIETALKNIDILITTHSTVAIDSIMMGIPLIIINLNNHRMMDTYIKEGVAVEATTEKQLGNQMYKIFNDRDIRQTMRDNQKRYRRHIIAFESKESAEKIAEIVISLIQ